MELSSDQQVALEGMLNFVQSPSQKVARLAGAAGTGKTSVLAEVAKRFSAAVVTPTNRAAGVLRKKGIAAATIHSQIYDTMVTSLSERIRSIEQAIEAIDTKEDANEVDLANKERLAVELIKVQHLLEESMDDEFMSFSLKDQNNLSNRVVIVDEASMVGEELLDDIVNSKPVCILLVGDSNQLPPVKDKPVFQGFNPDWTLTQQHRTSESSGILTVANAIIEHDIITAWRTAHDVEGVNTGNYNHHFPVLAQAQAESGELLEQKAVWITHTNRSRVGINNSLRLRMGLNDPMPLEGDILVTRKSIFCKPPGSNIPLLEETPPGERPSGQNVMQIPNGTFARVAKVVQMRAKKRDQFGRLCTIDVDGTQINSFLKEVDFHDDAQERMAPWQYAYCLTAHRAQGSEWDTVSIVGSPSLRRLKEQERNQWVYTALTRARRTLNWLSRK